MVEGQKAVERKQTRWMDGVYDTESERTKQGGRDGNNGKGDE